MLDNTPTDEVPGASNNSSMGMGHAYALAGALFAIALIGSIAGHASRGAIGTQLATYGFITACSAAGDTNRVRQPWVIIVAAVMFGGGMFILQL